MEEQIKEGYCDHCGAKIKKYTYTLTPALVDVLIELHKVIHKKNENRVSMKELRGHLKTYQYTQLSKLRFLGLIFKNTDSAGIFTGEWGITARGGGFLRGELQVPKRVTTFRNRVQHDETEDVESVTIKQVYNDEVPYIEGLDEIVYNSNEATEGQLLTAVIARPVELPRVRYNATDLNKNSSTFGQIVLIEVERVMAFKPVVVFRDGIRHEYADVTAFSKRYKIEGVYHEA